MIREATNADVDRIVEMGMRFWKEGPYHNERVVPEVAATFARNLMNNLNGKILVAERDGMLVGVIAFIVFPHFFTGELTATEMIWFVEPEHRRISSWPDGSLAIQLLRESERVAREMGAMKIQFTAPSSPVGGLYKRFGYLETETSYQRDL